MIFGTPVWLMMLANAWPMPGNPRAGVAVGLSRSIFVGTVVSAGSGAETDIETPTLADGPADPPTWIGSRTTYSEGILSDARRFSALSGPVRLAAGLAWIQRHTGSARRASASGIRTGARVAPSPVLTSAGRACSDQSAVPMSLRCHPLGSKAGVSVPLQKSGVNRSDLRSRFGYPPFLPSANWCFVSRELADDGHQVAKRGVKVLPQHA
jgi:hypothetical protein